MSARTAQKTPFPIIVVSFVAVELLRSFLLAELLSSNVCYIVAYFVVVSEQRA
jgi:hypothetical protein